MFSGNDIDLSTSNIKTFVDVNTVENSTLSSYYWTMNRYIKNNLSYVRSVSVNGGFSDGASSYIHGVRPVIYLKNNLQFTGGNGTAQNPYTLN